MDSDNHAQAAGAENNGGHLAADWWAVSLKSLFTSWHSLPGHKWSPPNSLPAPRVPIGSNVSCRNTEGNKNKSEFNNSMANDSHAQASGVEIMVANLSLTDTLSRQSYCWYHHIPWQGHKWVSSTSLPAPLPSFNSLPRPTLHLLPFTESLWTMRTRGCNRLGH